MLLEMLLKEEQSNEVISNTNRTVGIRNRFNLLKNVITVEPIILSFFISAFLIIICRQNLAIEKSCRVNLALDELICDAMMDKAKFGINCVGNNKNENNASEYLEEMLLTTNKQTNITDLSNTTHKFIQLVCWAEEESQKLGSGIQSYISPCESILSMITILFAGRWSDNTRKRIPCILFPLIGELVAIISFLIGAIFMKQLPVQFVMILGYLIPGLFGGVILLFMGLFSFLTEVTTEENRTLRFSVVVQLVPIISMVTLPFSGFAYRKLGYIKTFSIAITLMTFGILYTWFCLKEVVTSKQKNLVENDVATEDDLETNNERQQKKPNFIGEFFNPIVIKDCYLVAKKRRIGHRKKIIVIMLVISLFQCGPEWGELFNEYFFVRAKLNWEAMDEAPFATYGSCTSFLGTIIMVIGLGKYLHVSNQVIGIISSSFGICARGIYIFVSTPLMLYVGKTLDMFSMLKSILARSILTSVIDKSETGRMYSLLGIIENISKIVFIPICSSTYKLTVSYYPNTYFIWSFACLVIILSLFILTYVYLKQQDVLHPVVKEQKHFVGDDKTNAKNNVEDTPLMTVSENI